MSSSERSALKQLVSEKVSESLDQGLPNPLISRADYLRPLIGSMFMANLPRPRRTSIFSALVLYEGAALD